MVVMITMMFSFLLIYESSLSVNDAAIDNFDSQNKIYHTSISIGSLVSSQSSANPTFTLTNNDQEKLWDFDDFDVIIEYDGETGGGTRNIEVMTYSGTCSGNPPVGNWCIDTWNNDQMDPNILNNAESIDIIVTLGDTMFDTGIIIVTVSTDNGVFATISRLIS